MAQAKEPVGIPDPRVSFLLQPKDKLFPCAYNKSHFVLESKLWTHLNKCRNNYSKGRRPGQPGEIVICRYSFMHHIPVEEIQEHEAACPLNLQHVAETKKIKEEYVNRIKLIGGEPKEWTPPVKKEEPVAVAQAQVSPTLSPPAVSPPAKSPFGLPPSARSMASRSIGGYGRPTPRSRTSSLSRHRKSGSGTGKTSSTPPTNEVWEVPAPPPTLKGPFTTYDPRVHVRNNIHDFILNPQGLTKSEKEQYREKIWTGHFEDPEEEKDELSPVGAKFVPQTRDTRVPVGFPGWSLEEGNRRASGQQKRMLPH